MDVEDLVDSFSTTTPASTYAVSRRPRAKQVRGRPQPQPPTALSIVASVQPAKGADLKRLPEGRRVETTRVIFTATPLMVGGQLSAFEADQIAIDGDIYEVDHVESWEQTPSFGDTYFRCLATRVPT